MEATKTKWILKNDSKINQIIYESLWGEGTYEFSPCYIQVMSPLGLQYLSFDQPQFESMGQEQGLTDRNEYLQHGSFVEGLAPLFACVPDFTFL